ncbi:MAG: hypothetical protein HW389_2432 [Bacteroidetes bacterium]|nr:hypothetical protein [Bacteroidota bacterium]
MSYGILEVVEEMFFDNREIGAGQIAYTCVSAEKGSGKSMEEMKKVRVQLTRELTSDQDVEQLTQSKSVDFNLNLLFCTRMEF